MQKKIRLLFFFFSFLLIGINFSFSVSKPSDSAKGISLNVDFADAILHSYLDNRENKSYLSAMYQSNFSLDPYGDAAKRENLLLEEQVSLAINFMEQSFKEKECDISRKDFTNFLDEYSVDYQNDLSLLTKGKYKSSAEKKDSEKKALKRGDFCVKYNTCSKKSNVAYDCVSEIVSQYQQAKEEALQYQAVSTANMGTEKYFNNSLDDSPYDIQYDITAIEKIVFEGFEPKEEMFFYAMPSGFGEKKKKSASSSSNNVNQNAVASSSSTPSSRSGSPSSSSNPTSAPQTSPLFPPLDTLPMEGNENSTSRGKEISFSVDSDDAYLGDQEFENFFKGEDFLMVDASLGGKRCVPYDIQTQKEIQKQQRNLSDDILENDSSLVVDIPENIPGSSASAADNPPVSQGQTSSQNQNPTDTPGTSSSSVQPSDRIPELDDPNGVEKALEQAKKCVDQCEEYASATQRLNCKAQCLCGKYESPFFKPNEKAENLGLKIGPVLTLDFCTVPAMASTTSRKGGKVISIEEIFNEIKNVLEMLNDSGELGIFEQQTEVLASQTQSTSATKSTDISIATQSAVGNSASTNETPATVETQNLDLFLADANMYIVVQSELLKNPHYASDTHGVSTAMDAKEKKDVNAATVQDAQTDTQTILENANQKTQAEYRNFFNNEVVASLGNLEDLVKVMTEVVSDLQMVSESILKTA